MVGRFGCIFPIDFQELNTGLLNAALTKVEPLFSLHFVIFPSIPLNVGFQLQEKKFKIYVHMAW